MPMNPDLSTDPPFLQLLLAVIFAGRVEVPLAISAAGVPKAIGELAVQWLARRLPANAIAIIYRRADLAKMIYSPNTRLVVLLDARLAEEVSNRLTIITQGTLAYASLLILGELAADADLAMPSLRIDFDNLTLQQLHRWLRDNLRTTEPMLVDLTREYVVRIPPRVLKSLEAYDDAHAGVMLGTVLVRLLVGVCQIRRTDDLAQHAAVVTADDYLKSRELLKTCASRSGSDCANPLARAMAQRASIWLSATHRSRTITRREVANLGNHRSRAVRELLQHIVQLYGNDPAAFAELGITRDPSMAPTMSPDETVSALQNVLITWSEKQVRVHFHQLYVDGLLTAEFDDRCWQYVLPDGFAAAALDWNHFPSAQDLFGDGMPDLPEAGP